MRKRLDDALRHRVCRQAEAQGDRCWMMPFDTVSADRQKLRVTDVFYSERTKKRFFCLLPFAFCLISIFSFAQIDTKIDTANIKIGEPIHYTLTVPLPAKTYVKLPELQDTLSFHIEILDQKIDTVLMGEKKSLVQRLTLTSFDPGEFLIRSLPVVVDEDTLLSQSFQIKVEEVKIDSANLAGFPIKPIMEEEYTWIDYWERYWLYFLIGAIVFLALLIVAILFLRDKKRKDSLAKTPKTPYEEAKDALKALDKKNYLGKGQVNPYYSELSLVLRRYLGKVYHFSSLELLSDDLVDYFQKTTHLEKTEVDQLKEFLYESDLVKFAKAIPEETQNIRYRKWVEELVEKIKPLEIEEEILPEIKPNEKFRKLE